MSGFEVPGLRVRLRVFVSGRESWLVLCQVQMCGVNGFDVVCVASDEAGTASACNSRRQICRHNNLSTTFTYIGVKKSVSARWLIGLDSFTWIIDKLGILE